ncbi:transcriptional regulator PpsR [Thalassococcus sp. S3]|uniref:transcriptional regulator PpsR n=1 Tax=Thalassococcus sp. S3 TaxID=2017482 RepID=UPI001024869A|nr:transcriptional regulator PpsR [Thalassococcus sp. S3]QBF34217.1 transcriptional regulator PpsR [Thalassococcus sp. S3]
MNTRGSTFWSSGAVPLVEPETLSSIIAAASDVALVVSSDQKILSVLLNAHDESYGNLDHWEGRQIEEFLSDESVPKFKDAHAVFLSGSDLKKQLELNHTDNAAWEFPIRYTFHRIGKEDTVLMLGRDLRPIAETQQQLVQAQIALEKGYEARREFDARYRVLLASTRDAILFVSVRDGRIRDINDPAAVLLGGSKDQLTGSLLSQAVHDRGSGELMESLLNASMADKDGFILLQTQNGRRSVKVTPSVFRAAGERVVICRIEAEGADQAVDDQLTTNMSSLYRDSSDALLFTDEKGVIASANDSFLELIDAAHLADVRGRSLGDFLSRGQIDLSMLIENSKRGGQMRIYSTKLVNDFGSKLSAEISTTYLSDAAHPAIAFIIRDVSRVEAVRQNAAPGPDEASRNVMELVGSATLKEIVSETTDVVEKMCIETAVNLTRNNRVAAADMLGLSRQSLYVKLRKYGLLNKEKDR